MDWVFKALVVKDRGAVVLLFLSIAFKTAIELSRPAFSSLLPTLRSTIPPEGRIPTAKGANTKIVEYAIFCIEHELGLLDKMLPARQ
ncbi:MAG: hypothetical protein ABL908_12600 [Hyphomicrobium sp.]